MVFRDWIVMSTEDTTPEENSGGSRADNEPGYVETRGPPVPDVAYKVINPLMALILRSPLHSVVGASVMLLTFTGKQSGREYTTHSPWSRTLKGGQPVTLQLQGARREGVATPHHTTPGSRDSRIARAGVYRSARRRRCPPVGIRIQGDREPTYDELVDEVSSVGRIVTVPPTVPTTELLSPGAPRQGGRSLPSRRDTAR
jgi:hypothetical protein